MYILVFLEINLLDVLISRSLFNIEIGIRLFWLLESENKCSPDHPHLRQYVQKFVDTMCRTSDINELGKQYSTYVEDSHSYLGKSDVFKDILRENDALNTVGPPSDPSIQKYTISPLLNHTPLSKHVAAVDQSSSFEGNHEDTSSDFHETWRDCFQTPPTITKAMKPRIYRSSLSINDDSQRDKRKVSAELLQSFAFQSFLFASLRRASHSVYVNLNESHDQRDERLRKSLQDDFSKTESMFHMKCPLRPRDIDLNGISYEHVSSVRNFSSVFLIILSSAAF